MYLGEPGEHRVGCGLVPGGGGEAAGVDELRRVRVVDGVGEESSRGRKSVEGFRGTSGGGEAKSEAKRS